MEAAYSVEMKQIVKRFGGVTANDHVDFAAKSGEIHALLGENGAGKSTIMSILSGLYKADQGEILLHGAPAKIGSPKASMAHGIAIVYQQFRLVQKMTALENIILSERGAFWHGKSWRQKKREQIDYTAKTYGLDVNLDRPVWQMSVGEQQRIEILKTLYRGADIILLDEPTAVLTPAEAERLYETLGRMKEQGKTIVVSTHKLKEVMSAADRISVMRKGKMIRTMLRGQTSAVELAGLMVDKSMTAEPSSAERKSPGEALLQVKGLTANGDHGHMALKTVEFSVRKGEIVGVAGVAGNGQKELAEVLTGLRPQVSGTIELQGEQIEHKSVRQRIDRGMAHVPENRMKTGLAGSLGGVDNLLLKSYRTAERSRFGMMRSGNNQAWAAQLVEQFDVKTPGIHAPVQQLSGGNQQKLVFAREVAQNPAFMVAMHPTQGLDIGAAAAVQHLLLDLRRRGSGVLLISEDLDELLHISDRILVIYSGEILGSFTREEADRERIGLCMAGILTEEEVV
ncbi:ABC transporter ATP-binding protein [Paenibacillus hexagrammi]|uniref:ABC transporter ATP-binding protein n=1 Tax=Paenibacillus hexagrammi TaxID=2908839 RepID=A0ABY3SGV2_9BACL|nr:ABC transporter ATP-binding protein [Paenibacillus sp. YPD9-1]UJF32705.1 ABC transporter ATP-binding protein [Paenibacillus sp. YPD9-1]